MQFLRPVRALLGMVCLCVAAGLLWAQPGDGSSVPAISASQSQFLPVEEAYQLSPSVAADHVVLDWSIAPGYYLYRERMVIAATAGDQPLSVMLSMSAGEKKYDDYFERDTEIYHGQAAVTVRFPVVPSAPFTLLVESQGCADAGLCYPPQKQFFRIDPVALTVEPVEAPAAATQPAVPGQAEVPQQSVVSPVAAQQERLSLAGILLMALLGGLILNLMPCVFPVLSLKIFAMAAQRDRDDEAHWHSWVYAAGVVLSFVLVAGIMLALRAGGEAIGWGFQLQEPLFISLLVYLFAVLGLSFSGVVHIGGSLMGIGQHLVAGNPLRAAFFTGVLAVVVASPCSVPFMGVALGYAISQPTAVALLVFAVLGFGMALPFVLLAYWPQMLHRLPAPGAWMARLQQFLAFPLYATAVWLLWVLGQQGGEMAMVVVLGGLILLAMAGWLWRDASARLWEKVLAVMVLLVALVVPHFLVVKSCNLRQQQPVLASGEAEPYSAARLVELRAAGKPVFINMTAAWCLTCLVNEKVALGHDSVQQALRDRGITYLKGDWTNRDPEITSLLQQFGRNGVPLYLYFPPGRGGEIVVLPQVLTEAIVLDALK